MGLRASIGLRPSRRSAGNCPLRILPIPIKTTQDRVLPQVSRTFALTIPQLPAALRDAVTNAYLLCRIADTIEDEPALSPAETLAYLQRFKGVLSGSVDASNLASDLGRKLSDQTLPAERDLIKNMDCVIRVTGGLDPGTARGHHSLRATHV